MPYSHDPSTPAHFAELLAKALPPVVDTWTDWEPAHCSIGDVAMTAKTNLDAASILRWTVTLYPELSTGTAKGCFSRSSVITVGGKVETQDHNAYFDVPAGATPLDVRLAMIHAAQSIPSLLEA
jgi:hypothetical protein